MMMTPPMSTRAPERSGRTAAPRRPSDTSEVDDDDRGTERRDERSDAVERVASLPQRRDGEAVDQHVHEAREDRRSATASTVLRPHSCLSAYVNMTPSIRTVPGEVEDAGGREDDVVADPDERVDGADAQARDDGLEKQRHEYSSSAGNRRGALTIHDPAGCSRRFKLTGWPEKYRNGRLTFSRVVLCSSSRRSEDGRLRAAVGLAVPEEVGDDEGRAGDEHDRAVPGVHRCGASAPPKNGFQIVLEQRYDPTTTDFSSIITKIHSRVRRRRSTSGSATRRRTLRRRGGREPPDTAPGRVRQRRVEPHDGAARLPEEVGDVRHDDDEPARPEDERPAYNKYGAIMKQVFYHKYGLKTNIGGGIGWDNVAGSSVAEEGRWGRSEEDDRRVRVDREGLGRRPFTPADRLPLLEHAHYGFPPSQIALARLYGDPQLAGLLLRRVLVQNDAAFLVNGRPRGGGRFFCCACK